MFKAVDTEYSPVVCVGTNCTELLAVKKSWQFCPFFVFALDASLPLKGVICYLQQYVTITGDSLL